MQPPRRNEEINFSSNLNFTSIFFSLSPFCSFCCPFDRKLIAKEWIAPIQTPTWMIKKMSNVGGKNCRLHLKDYTAVEQVNCVPLRMYEIPNQIHWESTMSRMWKVKRYRILAMIIFIELVKWIFVQQWILPIFTPYHIHWSCSVVSCHPFSYSIHHHSMKFDGFVYTYRFFRFWLNYPCQEWVVSWLEGREEITMSNVESVKKVKKLKKKWKFGKFWNCLLSTHSQPLLMLLYVISGESWWNFLEIIFTQKYELNE